MDLEFHYWITGIVANTAGFSEKEAAIIAYASQFVDDNDDIRTVRNPTDGTEYSNYISQTMDILKPKQKLMRIYPIFHFLPGNPLSHSARRADGKMHVLNTTPDSELARTVLRKALAEPGPGRLHRIGVASHAFADTWAHQNFIGWFDNCNGTALNPLPNIGHADFIHHPDWPSHRWQDTRIIAGDINNTHRFLGAAKRLFEEYAAATKNPAPTGWAVLERDLLNCLGTTFSGEQNHGRSDRLAHYRTKAPWLQEYDHEAWFNAAVDTRVRGLPDSFLPSLTIFKDEHAWRPDWQTSNWYLFQEAVKAHQQFCMDLLAPIFEQMGVNLHDH